MNSAYNGRPSDSRGRYRPNRGRGRGGYDHGNPHGHNKPMSANVAANHGNKRSHANAFQPHAQQQSAPSHPSTATALPVPSFGLPLPSRPPIAAGASKKNKKKKRKHNQLGLTPRSHDHESSSSEGDNDDDEDEEHDADEESKLTKNLAAAAPLQFSYKGRTAKLQSAADIQAWIEERKKKFPTKARIEEKMKEAEQKKAKVDEAKRVKQEENKERREKFKAEKAQATDPADAAAKAKLKAEKLRRKLLKEEAKVAKAEADAERANKLLQQNEVKAVEKSDDTADKAGVQVSGDVPLPATGPQVSALDQKADSNVEREKSPSSTLLDKVEAALSGAAVQDDGDADINAKDTDTTSLPSQLEQEVLAVDEDWTSSSGSDTSSSSLLDDSDGDSNIAAKIEVDASTEIIDAADGVIESIGQGNDEDSDSAPDQSTSKRAGPERVLPPARKADAQQPAQEGKKGKSKQICNQFLKFGRCQRGQACKFLHERQVKANGATSGSASQRKSLFQILLEKEKENEDSRIMDAIIYLGQHGILDAPAATAPTEETEAGRTE
ncbi:hypothetical protein KEM56_002740 [Ascosphaera pollenicola]|nr:hypothetical protein KEM56_002740 [Ascosphaera pollenicola]